MVSFASKIEQMNFPQFVELKFIEWQRQQGGRKTISEFAEYLGIAQTTASSYMNGKRKPEGDVLLKLAKKLGIEIYDSLGLPRPDTDLYYLQTIWEDLDPAERQALREKAAQYAAQNKNQTENERKRRPKAAH